MTTYVDGSSQYDIMTILQSTISTIGIINNLIVVFAFLNDKKLRRKIPNIFIINQVSPYKEMALNFHLIIQQMVKKIPRTVQQLQKQSTSILYSVPHETQ